MEIIFERIETQNDIELLKYWLEDPELRRMARMTDTPLSDDDYQVYLDTLSFLVFVDGLAIGYARIYRYAIEEEGEIGIAIAMPEYRRRGLGTLIGQKVIATCLAMGMRKIHWATGDFNLPSIKLAEKLGFKFDCLIPDVIKLQTGNRNALVYTLEI